MDLANTVCWRIYRFVEREGGHGLEAKMDKFVSCFLCVSLPNDLGSS